MERENTPRFMIFESAVLVGLLMNGMVLIRSQIHPKSEKHSGGLFGRKADSDSGLVATKIIFPARKPTGRSMIFGTRSNPHAVRHYP